MFLLAAVYVEDSEIFFDNPVISSIIESAWKEKTDLYFVWLLSFICYLVLFDMFAWQYIYQYDSGHILVIFTLILGAGYTLFELVAMSNYYLRKMYFTYKVSVRSFYNVGVRSFYNIVNVCSIILPIITTAILTINGKRNEYGVWGFSQIEIDKNILFLIALSTFILWFQLLMLLRPFDSK